MTMDEMTVHEMAIHEMTIHEMIIHAMALHEMTIYEMTIGEMTIDEMTCYLSNKTPKEQFQKTLNHHLLVANLNSYDYHCPGASIR
jgi:hypothetical protein